MTWGSLNGTKQKMKHEITFPLKKQHEAIEKVFGKAGINVNY